MKLGVVTTLVVFTVFAAMSGPVQGSSGAREVMDCTEEQLTTAQQIIAEKLIQKSCMELKMDAAGVPDWANPAFCQNVSCVKAIKTVRKALPACTYNGKGIRAGLSKLLKVCPEGATNKREQDENDSGASSTPPKTKRPKTTAPGSTQMNDDVSSTSSSNGKEDRLDAESSSAPETTEPEPATRAPATTAAAKIPSTATKPNSSANSRNISMMLATMAVMTVWTLFS